MVDEELVSRVLAALGPLAPDTGDRLAAHLAASGPRGGRVHPVTLVRLVQERLPAPGADALAWALFAAADLVDDLADGDALDPRALGDGHRLLMAAFALCDDEQVVPTHLRDAVRRRLLAGVLAMWEGQDADVVARGRRIGLEASRAIARAKSGEQLATQLAITAMLAGAPPEPWEALGRDVGAAIQVASDVSDLLQPGESKDWSRRQPTPPLVAALAGAAGASVGAWLAGAADAPGRRAIRVAAAASAAVPVLSAEIDAVAASRDAAVARGCPREVVHALCAQATAPIYGLRSWCLGGRSVEATGGLGADVEAATRALGAFLHRDAALSEAVEVVTEAFPGEDALGGVFGRCLVIEALGDVGVEVTGPREIVAALGDADGWRYFPGRTDFPMDVDVLGAVCCAGVPGAERAASVLRAARHADGSFPTWVGPGASGWEPAACAVSQARAWRGLQRQGVSSPREFFETMQMTSPFYAEELVEPLVIESLVDADPDAARALLAARWCSIGLAGSLGGVASTALLVWSSLRLGLEFDARPVARFLADAVEVDGAPLAERLYRTIPAHGRVRWRRSRLVVAAWVLRALRGLQRRDLSTVDASRAGVVVRTDGG